jgi:D-tyrosyl-tRNA(Tyr) deacylase
VRVVLQRVSRASVTVEGETVGAIGRGLLLLVGVGHTDTDEVARRLAAKCAEMRIFPDAEGRFNRSLIDAGGGEVGAEALVVSQFTLLADVRKGRRPAFVEAAAPDVAEPVVEAFAEGLRSVGVRVATGVFGAHMLVESVNDGPVTIVVDSEELDRPRRS